MGSDNFSRFAEEVARRRETCGRIEGASSEILMSITSLGHDNNESKH